MANTFPVERPAEYDPYRYDRTPMQPRYSTGFLMQKAFENTREDLLGMNAGKFLFSDPIAADPTASPLMSPGDAKAKYNVDTGDDWLTEAQVAERSYLNMRRAERESVLSRASGFWQKSAIVGTTFAATFTDPAEVALALIPFVGSASYARLLARLAPAAKAGQMAFEAERVAMGFGRPLAVLEQMAGGKAKWGARAIAGATEGTLGTASYIPANWWIMSQQGRDFDSTEAFRQILAGAVLGIGFRTGFGKLGDLTMSADTRKALVREAAIALSKDQVPNFETIHALDEVRLRDDVLQEQEIASLKTDLLRQGIPEKDIERTPTFRRAVNERIAERESEIISSLQAKQLNRDLLTFVQGPELDRVRQEVIDHERLDPTNPDDMEKIAASAEKFSNDLLDDAGRRLDETDLEAINTMHNEAMQKLSAEEKAIDVAIGCVTTHA